MKNADTILILCRNGAGAEEAIRGALGLALDNRRVDVFLIDAPLPSPVSPDLADRLMMLDDLDGAVCTTRQEDASADIGLRFRDAADMGRAIGGYGLVINHGRRTLWSGEAGA